jgi:hypothetical protein
MADMITFFLNFNYDLCLTADNFWKVEEALDYLAAFLTNRDSWYGTEHSYKAFLRIREQLANLVKQSIVSYNLHLCETVRVSSTDEADSYLFDLTKSTVLPYEFICWAMNNNIPVPEQFANHVKHHAYQRAGKHEMIGLKKSTVHHERTRAVAEILWHLHPEMTINDMAKRPEIKQIGCDGHEYDTRTIARWLATLKANRRPGRPEKVDIVLLADAVGT